MTIKSRFSEKCIHAASNAKNGSLKLGNETVRVGVDQLFELSIAKVDADCFTAKRAVWSLKFHGTVVANGVDAIRELDKLRMDIFSAQFTFPWFVVDANMIGQGNFVDVNSWICNYVEDRLHSELYCIVCEKPCKVYMSTTNRYKVVYRLSCHKIANVVENSLNKFGHVVVSVTVLNQIHHDAFRKAEVDADRNSAK